MNIDTIQIKTLIQKLPCHAYWKNREGVYLGCNESMAKLAGLKSSQQVVGKTDYDLCWSMSADTLRKVDSQVINTGRPVIVEEVLVSATSNSHTFLSFKIPFFEKDNKLVAGIFGISIDITKHKKNIIQPQTKLDIEALERAQFNTLTQLSQQITGHALEEHATAQDHILHMVDYLDSIIACMPGMVYWKGIDGIYRGGNDNLAKLAGFQSRKEIIGKTLNDFAKIFHWDDEMTKGVIELDKYVMETGTAKFNHEELPFKGIDGKVTYQLSNKVPLFNKLGKVIGLVGISIDITYLKKIEAELREAKEAAEAANRAKTEFLENMRHDIRTPLTGIVGFASIIRDEVTDEKIKKYADNLVSSSYALLNLLNEILDLIKVSSGEVPIIKQKFSLKNRLYEVIQLNLAKASQKNIELIFDYDKKIPSYVIGDPRRFHRIVLELVANALKFTEKGQVKLTTQLLKSKKREIVVKVIVEDTGIGIDPDKQQEIFWKFKRLTPSYEEIYKGAGLGLAIVKQFVDELDGEIYVESRINGGTKFSCIFPFKKSLMNDAEGCEEDSLASSLVYPIDEPMMGTASLEVGTQHASQDKNTILVVEDQVVSAKIVTNMLKKLNCNVDLAHNGITAVQKVQEKRYNLIFLDIGLPDIDGYEVAKRIRLYELNKGINVPIIALTAHAGEDNKQRCLEVGMNAILTKPLVKEKAEDILNGFIPYRGFDDSKKAIPEKIASPIEGKIIDFEEAKMLLGNDESTVHEILSELVETFPEELAKMQGYYEKGDWIKLKELAHKIKGGSCYCGAVRLTQACNLFLTAIKDEAKETYIPLYEKLIREIKAVEKEFNDKTYF